MLDQFFNPSGWQANSNRCGDLQKLIMGAVIGVKVGVHADAASEFKTFSITLCRTLPSNESKPFLAFVCSMLLAMF
jgi:hypothetical protein